MSDGLLVTARPNGYVDFAVEAGKAIGLFTDEADIAETLTSLNSINQRAKSERRQMASRFFYGKYLLNRGAEDPSDIPCQNKGRIVFPLLQVADGLTSYSHSVCQFFPASYHTGPGIL